MVVTTRNTRYVVDDRGDGGIVISGDVNRCPNPTRALLLAPIEIGRHMEYRPLDGEWPKHHSAEAYVSTSLVVSIDHG